jgi:ElaB/YqjD/DUF883 family membrane-anchored ribosome-binding protein
MGLSDIWGLVWDTEPFHIATAIIFGIAAILEVSATLNFCIKHIREFSPIIAFLDKDKPLPDNHQNWSENHLKRHQSGEFKKTGGRYILQHQPAALSRPTPKSPFRFIPTVLTAIGVLGTFYGIQAGLKDISPQMADSQALLSASQTLFSGMRTAFSTSLMGLGTSSLFTIILAGCEIGRQRCHSKVKRNFDKVTILETPAQIFSRFDFEANRQAADSLSEAAVHMAKLDPNSLGQVIGECVGTSLERVMNDRLTPVFEEINASLKSLQAIKEDQGQAVLENLVQSLRTDVLEPIAQRLDNSAALTNKLANVVHALHDDMSGVSKNLANSVLTIQSFQKETLGELQLFAQQLQGTLHEFRTETKEVLSETAQGIKQGTIEILDRAQTSFECQSQTLQTVGTEASSIMATAKLHLVDSLHKVDEMLQNSTQQVDNSMKSIKETLQEFRADTREILNETSEGIKQGTLAILDRAQTSFEQQSQTLQTVGIEASGMMNTAKIHLVESLQRVDEMLQSSSHQVNNSMTSIKETAEAVSKLAMSDNLSWGARVHEIEEATRGIGKELQQSQKTNQEMQEAYRNTLSSWQNHLDQSFHRFSESQSKFFDGADDAMARVCTKFLETVNVLVEIEKYRHN